MTGVQTCALPIYPPPPGSAFDFQFQNLADPALLAASARLYRPRRGSMDLPLDEGGAGGGSSSGSGTFTRLQPVTEEMCSYMSPELPLPPGSLLLHGAPPRDRSPEPSSDSLESPPPHQPPPHQGDSSAAQSIPHPSYYGSEPGGGVSGEGQGHPPSQQTFLYVPPSPAEPSGGTATHLSLLQAAWARRASLHAYADPGLGYGDVGQGYHDVGQGYHDVWQGYHDACLAYHDAGLGYAESGLVMQGPLTLVERHPLLLYPPPHIPTIPPPFIPTVLLYYFLSLSPVSSAPRLPWSLSP